MLVLAESHCLLPRLFGTILVTSAIVNLFGWQEAIAHTAKSFPNALVTNLEGYVLGCESSNLPIARIRCENCKMVANDLCATMCQLKPQALLKGPGTYWPPLMLFCDPITRAQEPSRRIAQAVDMTLPSSPAVFLVGPMQPH